MRGRRQQRSGRDMRVVSGGRLTASPFRKGVYVLPNLITTAGLFAGVFSITATLRGDYVIAAVAIIIANVCDVLDGRIARVTRTTSDFGIEYDSLSDLVAFGVAPGLLLYRWALEPWATWGWLAMSLYVACGALRLARFNVQVDTAEKRHFVGLPIPAAAEMITTTVLLLDYLGFAPVGQRHLIVLLFVYALSALMVSNIRYFSFKEIHLERQQPFWMLLAFVILLNLLLAVPQVFLFCCCLAFVASGPVRAAIILWRRFSRRGRGGGRSSSLTRSAGSPR